VVATRSGEYVRIGAADPQRREGACRVIVRPDSDVIFFQIKSSVFLSAGNGSTLMASAAFIITSPAECSC